MRAFFIKSNNGAIYPRDEDTRKYVKNRRPGTVICADIKIARNYENHKRFFAFIKATFDMQDHFTQMEAYRYWLTMKAGWFDTVVAPNGNVMFKAKSIDFESMDEDEFKQLFSAAIDAFLKELGNGMTEDEILRAISFD